MTRTMTGTPMIQPRIYFAMIDAPLHSDRSHRRYGNHSALVLPLLLCGFVGASEPPRRLFPVRNRPPGLQVIGAPVFMFEVIGMLPDVVDQDGEVPLHQGIVVTGGRVDLEPASILLRPRQPYPSGPEHLGPRFRKPDLELLETAEIPLDCVGERTRGRAASCRRHGPPEHAVVHMSARIVADGGSRFLRNLAQVQQQPERRAF